MSVATSGLSIRFGPQVLFESLTFTADDGTLTAVLGPSGSGKSTLLATIAGYRVPDDGRIDTFGVLRDEIGFMFQNPHLIPSRSVRDNIALGALSRGVDHKTAAEVADELAATMGLSSILDAKVASTSGGERQRVAVLRAIARKDPILLADEPTASLDSESCRAVVEALRGAAAAGATVIAATHDPLVAEMSDQVVRLRR